MPRLSIPLNPENPCHVTGRCHNRSEFPVPLADAWQILSDQLFFTSHAFLLRPHAFLMMPNHFHLLVSAPHGNLSDAMSWFMRETARQMNRQAKLINQLWGARFFRSEIRSDHYYNHCYKYLYRNPVRANMVEAVEDYPFSTWQGLIGNTRTEIPIYDELAVTDPKRTHAWLNQTPPSEYDRYIKLALRRNVFQLPLLNHRNNPLESEMF